jgi:hypothetical protein
VIIIETDRPGLERNKRKGNLGIRAHDTAEIRFSDVWVPEENLVGEEGSKASGSYPHCPRNQSALMLNSTLSQVVAQW